MNLVFQPQPPVLIPVTSGEAFPVRRVFCVGQNYAAHAREMGRQEPAPPFFFTAWAETVMPGGGVIAYPPATGDYHHEVELVAAVGRGGRDIDEGAALGHVFGYAVGLDMTRRDLQGEAKGAGRPWDAGKNVEQGKPVAALTPADGFDPARGAISLSVNGETRQSGDLGDMLWPVGAVIARLSRLWRLEPGDLIFTGTPAGVGPVRTGDRIEAKVEGLTPLAVEIGGPAA
jgi:fumarylpyruvate hydrolase